MKDNLNLSLTLVNNASAIVLAPPVQGFSGKLASPFNRKNFRTANCPAFFGLGGVIELECYNRHHQREKRPWEKGADDVLKFCQAVQVEVQISNCSLDVKGREGDWANHLILRDTSGPDDPPGKLLLSSKEQRLRVAIYREKSLSNL